MEEEEGEPPEMRKSMAALDRKNRGATVGTIFCARYFSIGSFANSAYFSITPLKFR